MTQQPPNIETQVNVALAFRRYLTAAKRANEARREFAEACDGLRVILRDLPRLVIEHGGDHYLVAIDPAGDLSVERVCLL